jgi:hypothetical protein
MALRRKNGAKSKTHVKDVDDEPGSSYGSVPISDQVFKRTEIEVLLEEGPNSVNLNWATAKLRTRAVYAAWSVAYGLSDSTIQYYMAYIAFTFLGNFVSDLFFAYHLFDLVYRYESLRNVLRAVTHNGVQLTMTFFLGLILIYVFSIFAFAKGAGGQRL